MKSLSEKYSKKPPLESKIEKAICDYLTMVGMFVWKNKDKATHFQGKFIKSNSKYKITGVADLTVCWKGMVFFVEVKRPSVGKQSDNQKEFQRNIEKNNCIYILTVSPSDCFNQINNIIKNKT